MTVNHLLQGKTALIAKRPRKPCSVRQPTIGSVASANGSGRCPGNKKFLTERSKTVANLDPMLKPEKVMSNKMLKIGLNQYLHFFISIFTEADCR